MHALAFTYRTEVNSVTYPLFAIYYNACRSRNKDIAIFCKFNFTVTAIARHTVSQICLSTLFFRVCLICNITDENMDIFADYDVNMSCL